MSIIERLKSNTSPFGLMVPELREVAEKIGKQQMFEYFINGMWWLGGEEDFWVHYTYRLRADFRCQHPETKKHHCMNVQICCWCGAEIEPEKKPEWVECEIEKHCFRYGFNGPEEGEYARLDAAPGMVGFGGIRYEAPCECGRSMVREFYMAAPEPCEQHGPCRPVAVRFWREVPK